MIFRPIALTLIRAYQHYLSPHKHFACAYRVMYGGSGCSGVGFRLIRRYGVIIGYRLLRKRLARCRFAHQQMRPRGLGYYQRGECDMTDCFCEIAECGCDIWGNHNPDSKPKKKSIKMPNLSGSD